VFVIGSDQPEDAPQVEFPCDYPVKVMGLDVDGFSEAIIEIIRRHAPDLKDENISFRPSKHGKYLAVNVIILAQGVEQLQALFEDLKASGRVAMVI
jgi:putative lipoic acid-binding regulatory protein